MLKLNNTEFINPLPFLSVVRITAFILPLFRRRVSLHQLLQGTCEQEKTESMMGTLVYYHHSIKIKKDIDFFQRGGFFLLLVGFHDFDENLDFRGWGR